MNTIKALGYLGMAAAGVLVIRLGLDLAVNDLASADPARERQADVARSEAPRATLAPVMTPSPATWGDEDADPTDEERFGAPDPDFGRATPAVGQPALSMAERQRRIEAAAVPTSAPLEELR